MQWVKASERQPTEAGWIHVRSPRLHPDTNYFLPHKPLPDDWEWLDESSSPQPDSFLEWIDQEKGRMQKKKDLQEFGTAAYAMYEHTIIELDLIWQKYAHFILQQQNKEHDGE